MTKLIDFKPLSFKEYSNFVGNSNLLSSLGIASVEMCLLNKTIVNANDALEVPTEGNEVSYSESGHTYKVKLEKIVNKCNDLSTLTNTSNLTFPDTSSSYTHSAIICKVKGTVAKTITTSGTTTTVTPTSGHITL